MKLNLKIILTALIIINLIILVILLNCVAKMNNGTASMQNASEETYTGSIEYNNKIYPANHYEFEKLYNSDENCKTLYENLYNFVYYIPKIYNRTKDLTDAELETFFDKYKESIIARYHITTKNEFVTFIKQCKKVASDSSNSYKTVRFLIETYKKGENYITCDFEIEYRNNIILKYRLNLSESETNALQIRIQPIE